MSNDARMTYYKYKCPNGIHQFVLLKDVETCIHCYIKDKVLEAVRETIDKVFKLAYEYSKELDHCTDDQVIYTGAFMLGLTELKAQLTTHKDGNDGN